MATDILAYDEGYDAYLLDEGFDPDKCQSWQDGYFDAVADDDE